MDLWQSLQVVRRRWYVVLPLLIVTVGIAFAAGTGIEPDYHASADVILLPVCLGVLLRPARTEARQRACLVSRLTRCRTSLPRSSQRAIAELEAEQKTDNPFITSGLGVTANALQFAVSSAETNRRLVSEGLSTDYVLGVQRGSPIMSLAVVARNP